ncbi:MULTISPECIES: hypothetical protein [Streptomyces]|uniref:Uncharacterized protein n=1 Tax=Streptomyces flaveolus TaxID=67297 RepID=A0ABV1VG55_9ACTN
MKTYEVILSDGARLKIKARRWAREAGEEVVTFFGSDNKPSAVFSLRGIVGVVGPKALDES